MRTSCFLALAALALLPRSARCELDFTLQRQMVSSDAVAFNQPYIMDGPNKVYLRFPNDWRALDSGSQLELLPTLPDSSIRFENYHGKELTIDEAGGQQMLQQALAQLPKDAKNVAAYPVECNPFPILGWTDLRVTVRYENLGRTFRRSTMYVNMRPGRIVEYIVTALDQDFDKLAKPARTVLASIFEPSTDLPPDLASKYETGDTR